MVESMKKDSSLVNVKLGRTKNTSLSRGRDKTGVSFNCRGEPSVHCVYSLEATIQCQKMVLVSGRKRVMKCSASLELFHVCQISFECFQWR